MLDSQELWTYWVVSVGVAVPLVAVLLACICGCRKSVPKNELLGLAGMVKITNPEENLNHNHQSNDNAACTVVGSGRSCADTTDNRRASSTANRSLPDIPIDSDRVNLESGDTLWEIEANGDTNSELYATVEENKHLTLPSGENVSLHTTSRTSMKMAADEGKGSEHSSLSQTDDSFSPYARLKAEHPYDRLRNSEHPYAQVGASTSRNGEYEVTQGRPKSLRAEDPSRPSSSRPLSTLAGPSNPIPPPRTRRSSSHNSLVMPSTSDSIQAATAIAGRVSANQDMPYMTPPIPGMVPQTNFSGDSQDSKGYTSISVREPLANIKAQTKESNQRLRARELLDSHYTTVSDDSDEMYAAIDEPGQQVYTSGSETYAQIQPALAPGDPINEGPLYSAPQPPSVDSLKQVAQVHSRQASSSSATSSVANLGSPKPEKRQANSPLPPPPAGSPELYAAVDKKRNLEDMYAKVMKKKKAEGEASLETRRLPPDSPGSDTPHTLVEVDSSSDPELSQESRLDSSDTPHNSLTPSYNDPGYEVVQRQDPNYEELRPKPDTLVTPPSKGEHVDPGYEQVAAGRVDVIVDRSDENQEQFVDEPNYESMSSEGQEPNYAVVSDPNYEVVNQDDPNYESVNYFDLPGDPPYERLHEPRDSDDTTSGSGYEKVMRQDNTSYGKVMKQPTDYGNVMQQDNTDYEKVMRQDNADYEKVMQLDNTRYGKVVRQGNLGYEKVMEQDSSPGQEKVMLQDNTSYGKVMQQENPGFERVMQQDIPVYEKVMQDNPGYEKVMQQGIPKQGKVMDLDNSGYELVLLQGNSGYEKVMQQDNPGYEKVMWKDNSDHEKVMQQNIAGHNDVELRDAQGLSNNIEPGYEEIGKSDIACSSNAIANNTQSSSQASSVQRTSNIENLL